MRRLWIVAVAAGLLPAATSAEDSFRHGRLRHVEPGVSLQRGVETGTEEAEPNMPFLPGDRVWTDGRGRVEFQFAGGSVLRLDRGSKLDYVAHEEYQDELLALRLWSGALYVHTRDSRDPVFEIETPGGVIRTLGSGMVRIDVQGGEARISVYEGEASLEGTRGARLQAGERAYAQRGEVVEGPESFDRRDGDDFAAWDDERRERTAYASSRPAHLPEDVAPYWDELESNGAWYYESEVGHVWRPYVAATWQPYSHGRWIWTAYGWTWVPAEPWGWAPSHFGRWGWSSRLGWYWIPGRTWGPAWVSWSVGGGYVGWCPLGYRNRPVLVYGRRGGHAVPRGRGIRTTASTPWIYLRKGDVGARNVAKRRVQVDQGAVAHLRTVDATQGRLTRDLTLAAGAVSAPARTGRTRPTLGGDAPARSARPMATPMTATPRRIGRSVEADQPAGRGEVRSGGQPATRRTLGESRSSPRRESGTVRAAPAGAIESGAARRRSRTGGTGTVGARPAERPVERGTTPRSPSRPRDAAAERPARGGDEGREVLRPMFRSLGQPRDEGARSGGGGAAAARPRGGESQGAGDRGRGVRSREASPPRQRPQKAEPRRADPPPAPRAEAPAQRRSGAKRRNEG